MSYSEPDARAGSGAATGSALLGLVPLRERGAVPAVFRVRDEAEYGIGGDRQAGHAPEQPATGNPGPAEEDGFLGRTRLPTRFERLEHQHDDIPRDCPDPWRRTRSAADSAG